MLSATRASAAQPRLARGSRAVAPRSVRPVLAPSRRLAPLASPPRASSGGDFDDVLAKYADRWEKAENKPAIVGGFLAAAAALWIGEWTIHAPVLSFLVGEPLNLIALAVLPVLGVRYFVEKKDLESDIEEQVKKILGVLFKK